MSMKQTGMAAGVGSLLLLTAGLAHAEPGVVTGDLNVRAGEGTNYRVLDVIPRGTPVEVSGCRDGWCFVRDYQGYASANYIAAAGDAFASYMPGNRLRYRQPERFFGPPAADYRGHPDVTGRYFAGNRLEYRKPDRFFGPPAADYRGHPDVTGQYVAGNRLQYRQPYRYFGPEPPRRTAR